MNAPYLALLSFVGLVPVLCFFDGAWLDGLIGLFSAGILGLVAITIRPGEAGHLLKTMRWPIALAAIPVIWVVLQLLPLPLGTLSRSIWQSAGDALGAAVWPRMTIDPGLTFVSMCKYLFVVAIGLSAAAISIDRMQAERLFMMLGGACGIAALLFNIHLLLHRLGGVSAPSLDTRPAALTVSIFGLIVFAGIIILLIERKMTRGEVRNTKIEFYLPLSLAILGLILSALAVVAGGSEQAIFAACCGLITIAIIYFVRRIGLGWHSALAMFGAAVVGAALIISTKASPASADFSLRYAAGVSLELIGVVNRMIGEVGLGGSGAGTFAAIFPIYSAQDAAMAPGHAPTVAAQLAIELGRPVLWLSVAAVATLILLCARGAFSRGRDFFYPMVGAAAGVSALTLAFCDNSLSTSAVQVALASLLGLSLAQSASRTL